MRLCRLMLIVSVLLAAVLATVVAFHLPWQLLIVLGIAVLVKLSRKKKALDSFGTAAWASAKELEAAGMTEDGPGLCVGVINWPRPSFWAALCGLFDGKKPSAQACEDLVFSMRKLQRYRRAKAVLLNKAVHTAVIAPTGAGKGVSLIIPFLFSCRDSCVVIDPKGENAKLTADARRAMGQRVVILDPFKIVTQTPDTLNILDSIDTNSPTALDDCRAIANQIVIVTGSEPDPHWNARATAMITALIAITLFLDPKDRHLQTVRLLLTDTERRNKLLAHMSTVGDWGGMLARICKEVSGLQDKELAGVLSTANRHMNFLDTPAVAESTTASTFDSADMFELKVTKYLVMPSQYLDSHAGLLRLWLGADIRATFVNGIQETHLVHLILDECASLGRMDILKHAVDKARGYGLRAIFFFQALSQIKEMWPNGQDQTLLANVTLVLFGIRDKETAEHVSALLGKETIWVTSCGTNTGGSTSANRQDGNGSYGTSWGANRGYQQHAREMLTPDEVINLPERTAITLTRGVRPILTTLTRYYEGARGNGRWRNLRMKAEIWTAAIGLLALLGTLGWCLATALFSPKGSQ